MFDDDTLYLAGDPALLKLGRPSTLAHWRSEGRGPAFIKLGSRVAYRGSELNAWLAAQTVRPTAPRANGIAETGNPAMRNGDPRGRRGAPDVKKTRSREGI